MIQCIFISTIKNSTIATQFYHILVTVLFFAFFGCEKEPNPNPDLVGVLIGTYQVKESINVLNSKIDTTRLPYLIGKIIIERSNTDPADIGISGYTVYNGNGSPVSEEQFNESLKMYPMSNPQKNTLSVSQKNDTIYFSNNKKAFGKYFGGTLIYRVINSPTWEITLVASK